MEEILGDRSVSGLPTFRKELRNVSVSASACCQPLTIHDKECDCLVLEPECSRGVSASNAALFTARLRVAKARAGSAYGLIYLVRWDDCAR
jgi:hypothetical protein